MKKINFMLFAVAAIAAASCAKEITPENPQNGNNPEVKLVPMTFSAGGEKVDAKVALQSDGKTLHWESSDQIKVFDGISNELPAFTTTGSGASVDFTGKVSENAAGPFYAVYPYQEDAALEINGQWNSTTRDIIYAEVPAIQTAKAGDLPSDAFIAVAKSDSKDHFKFMSVCGYVKITINDENAENIESITLSGNNNESIAGKMKIAFKENGDPENTYVSGGMSTTVTLKGSFSNGKDYYFAVRTSSFSKGITLSTLYKNGTRKYISSSKAPETSLGRNQVMNIGAPVMKSGTPNDLYIAWNHGFDIDVAGEKFSKAMHGEATLINNDSQTATVGNVYFVDPNYTFKVGGTTFNDKLIVIGRYANQRSTLTQNGILKLGGTSAIVAFKGLNITWNNTNQPFQITADSKCIAIDNCYYNYIKNSITSSSQYVVDTFAITNSEIHIKDKDKVTIYSSTSASTTSYLFRNNIVFVTGNTAVTEFRCLNLKNGTSTNILIENNIFDKTIIPNNSLVLSKAITNNLTIKNNIFHDVVASTTDSGLINYENTAVSPAAGDISANFYYNSESGNSKKLITRTKNLGNLSKNYSPALASEAILSANWDPVNGDFGIKESFTYTKSDGTINTQNTANIGAHR